MCFLKDVMGRTVPKLPRLFAQATRVAFTPRRFSQLVFGMPERARLCLPTTIIIGLTLVAGQWKVMAQRPLGVDVSDYQGTGINWTTVKNSGISFAWTKATEGAAGQYVSQASFTINESNGKAVGIYMGAYHFAHPGQNAPAAEVSYFWSVAGNYIAADGLTLMPMLDMEVFSGVTGASSYSQWVNMWCTNVDQNAAGKNVSIKPFIYVSACNAGNFDTSVAQWYSDIADYNGENAQTGTAWSTCTADDQWGGWNVWQYTDAAIEGDGDVFNGTAAGLVTFVASSLTNAPAFTTQPQNTTVTLGSNVTFTAAASGSPLPTYQWKFNATNIPGATTTSLTITNAQTTNAGVYSAVASNVAGTVTSSNATLTVYIPLTITAQPTNLAVLKGSTATFRVSAIGTPPPGYQWQFNDVSIPGATSNVLTIPNVQTNKDGNYTVSVTNSTGSIISSNATLTVVTAPAITGQPTNQTVIQGNSTTFTVTATGTPTLSYQWMLGGSNISGANASSYAIASVQPGQAGSYQVVVTNNYGTATSSNALLTVLSPPAITGQPRSVTVAAGSNATFTVTATGTSLTYQWLFNSGVIGGANGTSYTVVGAQTNNAGNYSVLVTNTLGSVTSSNALLTVSTTTQAPQFLSVTVTNGVVQMVLSGQTGVVYAIDGSSNLVDWVQLTSFTNTTGTYQFADPSLTNNPLGFYRARSLP